jgi:HK97 family phage major capsid protein
MTETAKAPGAEAAAKLAEELKKGQEALQAEYAKGLEKNSERIETIAKEMNEKIDGLNAHIQKKFAAGTVPGSEEDGGERKFSMGRLRKALMLRSDGDHGAAEATAPYEFEVCKAARESWTKAMGTVPDSAGGELVPLGVMPEVIESLRAVMILERLGARTIGGLSQSPVHIRKVTGNTTAYWVAENPSAAVTTSDMALGHISATPHRLAARTTMSEDLIDFSSPAIESLANQDQGETLGLEMDRAGFKGSGSSGEPLGLDGMGITVGTSSSTDVAQYAVYEDMVALRGTLRGANAWNRPGARFGWAMHPDLLSNSIELIKSENATAGTQSGEVTRTMLSAPPPDRLLGLPFETSTQLNGTDGSADLYLGNWNEFLIFMWGALQMKVTDAVGSAAAQFQKDLITSLRVDFNTRHIASFVKLNDMDT